MEKLDRKMLLDEMAIVFNKCLEIAEKKNKDYAKNTDPFMNLRACEILQVAPTETGMLVRMTDKFTRVCNLIGKEPDVIDESIDDTILDFINYLSLLLIYLHDKEIQNEVV